MKGIQFLLLFVFSACNLLIAKETVFIRPNNDKLVVQGAFFIKKSKNKVVINRHNEEFLNHTETFVNAEKANTQSGVTILFSTNSSNITLHFQERTDAQHRQKKFGVFKNGKFYSEKTGPVFLIENDTKNEFSEWKIVLPAFYGIDFLGIEIDPNASLKKIEQRKRLVYVAIGNSITHGVGQNGAGYLTYPYLLAEQKNWELFNLAVGGSKISWTVAQLLENKKVDIISILWGYNDWNSTFTLEDEIRPYYRKLLTTLRRVQPNARIYCILPTYSKRLNSKSGNDALDDIRKCQSDIISELQQKGDKQLYVINGKDITSENDLNDDVHLSVEGAKNFAAKLEKLIK